MRTFRAVLAGLMIVGVTLVLSATGIVTWPFSPNGRLYLLLARVWSRVSFWLTGVQVTVGGRERVDWSRPYVLMANHQSSADVMAIFYAVPQPVRLIAKRSLAFLPVFGWGMALARFIFVERSDPRSALRTLGRAAARVRGGDSVAVFPEGTRSADGRVQDLKPGGFVIAQKAGVAILPVAIIGSNRCLAKGQLRIHSGRFHVELGTPIEHDPRRSREELMARVHGELTELVGDNTVERFFARRAPRPLTVTNEG